MTESDFWLALEWRVCREFAGMPTAALCRLWCDGFVPERYLLNDTPARITGRAWIVDGQEQQTWEFTLSLDGACVSGDGIDWPSLLPPANVTRWVTLDVPARRLSLEPGTAVSDEG